MPGSVKKRQPEGGYCVKVTGKSSLLASFADTSSSCVGLPKNWYKRDIRRLFTASEIVSERGIYLENENDNNSNQGGTAYIEFVSEVDLEKALFFHDEHYGSSRLEIQPITKKEMESEIGALRSKDNRRRDHYDGDLRSRVRSRSRKSSVRFDHHHTAIFAILRLSITFTQGSRRTPISTTRGTERRQCRRFLRSTSSLQRRYASSLPCCSHVSDCCSSRTATDHHVSTSA